jgi:hypothetical protein
LYLVRLVQFFSLFVYHLLHRKINTCFLQSRCLKSRTKRDQERKKKKMYSACSLDG